MSICSSGASTTRPGVPSAVVVDQAYVQSILPAGLAWAYPYLPFMHGLQIGDVGAFCALDPPSYSLPTGPEIYALITSGDLGQADVVQQFLQNVTRSYLWYSLCQCTTGATPAAPAAPAAPAGLPQINPPSLVTPGPALPCWDNQVTFLPDLVFDDIISSIGSTLPGAPIVPNSGIFWQKPTQITLKVTIASDVGSTATWRFRLGYFNATGSFLNTDFATDVGPGQTTTLVSIPPATAYRVEIGVFKVTGAGANHATAEVIYACAPGGANGISSPCCPPDPTAKGMLSQLLQLMTLVQRQSVPFAYVQGTAHAGLTGNGSFAVSGILGLKVALTTVPTRLGSESGDPIAIWNAGWVNLGTADGFGPRYFIASNPFLVTPVMGAVTVVGYSIPGDVVATITELIREP